MENSELLHKLKLLNGMEPEDIIRKGLYYDILTLMKLPEEHWIPRNYRKLMGNVTDIAVECYKIGDIKQPTWYLIDSIRTRPDIISIDLLKDGLVVSITDVRVSPTPLVVSNLGAIHGSSSIWSFLSDKEGSFIYREAMKAIRSRDEIKDIQNRKSINDQYEKLQ